MIRRILRHMPDIEHPLFQHERRRFQGGGQRSRGLIVITGDKGLAGAYNHNVLKIGPGEWMEQSRNHRLYVVGELGRQYFAGQTYSRWRSSSITRYRTHPCTGPG
ncbi:MAG: F0F1 ATP synthase subunit gamma [Enterocloster bolteae]